MCRAKLPPDLVCSILYVSYINNTPTPPPRLIDLVGNLRGEFQPKTESSFFGSRYKMTLLLSFVRKDQADATHFSLRSTYDMKTFADLSLEVYPRGHPPPFFELLMSHYRGCPTALFAWTEVNSPLRSFAKSP